MIGHPALPAHFWAKVTPDADGCWIWTGAHNNRGYGAWGVDGKATSTHRITYQALVGPIPDGLQIDHLCRVKSCCNPTHLEPVTGAENVRRARATQTHCAEGHPLDGDNLALHATRRTRICIACRRESNRRYRINRKEAA